MIKSEQVVYEDNKWKIVKAHNRGAKSAYYNLFERISVLGIKFWWYIGWSISLTSVTEHKSRCNRWDDENR